MDVHLSPAQYAARVFGGVCSMALALGRSPGRVCNWTRPSDGRDGTGGRIPSDSAKIRLLEIARERGLDLTPSDLLYGRDLPDEPTPTPAAMVGR